MTKTLKPLNDRLIVRLIAEDAERPSGIVLPQAAVERPIRGKVIAVGDGRWNEWKGEIVPLTVVVGDVVIFSKFGGAEIKIGDEELTVLRENDVLAIEREAEPIA